MFKKLFLLLLLTSLILFSISCNSDTEGENNKNFDCTTCQEYEICNESEEKCDLKIGACKDNSDCTNENEICNLTSNSCEEKDITMICTDNETKCEVNKLFTCNNNTWETTDCNTDNKTCETIGEVSSCVEKEQLEYTIPEVKALTEIKTVITNGIITYINVYDSKVAGFYMQKSSEDNGAIYVFIKDGISSSLKLGDTVKVTGLAWPKFGIMRIGDNDNSPSFEIINSTSTIPNPKEISSSDLSVEEVDMLININNVPFTVLTMGDAPLYHTIIKDSNDNQLIINSKLYRFNENGLTVGSEITNIKGIAGSYQNNDESFIFLVRPRDASDIKFNNEGTEGNTCKTTSPECIDGLKCVNNICEIRLPCDEACSDSQYCDIDSDNCIDIIVETIANVKALTEDKLVIIEGYVSFYKKHNQTTETIYMQDATTANSGIVIYIKNIQGPAVSIGQKIRVRGIATDYQGFIQIGTGDAQPIIEDLGESLENNPKIIASTEINEDNLSILVEMDNPPFTVTEVEFDHPKYVTFTDNLGNSFILNNDFVNDWVYFFVDDVLTSLKGLVSYRSLNGITFTINPRSEDDFIFNE